MELSDLHASDEVGIYKGFRVHKDSHGGLFLLKKRLRHYLSESEKNQVEFLDQEHMNQLPLGENILTVKLSPNQHMKIEKHEEELKKIGTYTREGQFKGKEVYSGAYGGFFLINNQEKLRLKNSDRNFIENFKHFNEKEKVGVFIGKGKKHGHTVFRGKLGAFYCLINDQEALIDKSEKKFISNFQKVMTKKLNKKNDQEDDDDDDVEDDDVEDDDVEDDDVEDEDEDVEEDDDDDDDDDEDDDIQESGSDKDEIDSIFLNKNLNNRSISNQQKIK